MIDEQHPSEHDEAHPEPDSSEGDERPSERLAQPSAPSSMRVGLVALGLVSAGIALIVASRGKQAATTGAPALTSAAIEAPITLATPLSVASPVAVDAGAAPFVPVWRVSSLSSDTTVEISEVKVGKHKSFIAAAMAAGVSRAEARRVAKAFEDVHSLGRVRPTETLVFARERSSGRVVAFELQSSPSSVWQAREDDAHRLTATQLAFHVESRDVRTALSIDTDLSAACGAVGHDDTLVHAIDDALHGHVAASDIRAGTRLRVVATEERVEGARAGVHVDAIEYTPASGSEAKAQRVYFYARAPGGTRRGPSGYYNALGQQPYQGAFRSPVPLARVTSRFNPKRMHPVLHVVMPHNGVDFGGATGTPVYASAAGTVVSAGNAGPCGNMVELRHAGNVTTAYCHLSKFASGLHGGQHVEQRQLIGYVGQTGRVTGPHLHFIAKRGGKYIDPLALKLDGVRVLPSRDRDAFRERRATLDAALDAITLPSAGAAPADAPTDEDHLAGD